MKFSDLSVILPPLASSARTIAVAACISFVASGVACSSKSDTSASNTDAGSGATAAAAATSGASSGDTASDATMDDKTKLPVYPGASVNGSASANGQAGTVLTTADSFDKVYDWYKSKMPDGSEKAKVSSGGMSSASFVVSKAGAQETVAITTQGDKTMISLAQTSQ